MTEKLLTGCFLALSSIYLYNATCLTFGTIRDPHSGFLPVWAGGIAVTIALLLCYQQFRRPKPPAQTAISWSKFIFVLIGFAFYIIMFKFLGYLVATFIFLFYLFKIADTAGWMRPLIIAAISSAAFYWLFNDYLTVTLP